MVVASGVASGWWWVVDAYDELDKTDRIDRI